MNKIKNNITLQILIGVIAGILAGLLLHGAGSPVMDVVSFFSKLYMNSLRMMIYPMIFCSIVTGVAIVGNAAVTGKIALRGIIYFAVTTLIACVVAVAVPTLTGLGLGTTLNIEEMAIESEMTGIGEMIVNMVPANPFAAFANGDVLQILVFAIVVGFALLAAGEKGAPVLTFFRAFNEICMQVIGVIMRFTPFGVFFLMIPITANNSFETFASIIGAVIVYYVTLIIYVPVVYLAYLKLRTGTDIKSFLKGCMPAFMTAFATSSSSAALPVSKRCMDDMGIREEVSSLILPLGSTVNMNGSAIILLMMIIFYCNCLGIALPAGKLFALIIATLLTSIGAPAIPNGGIASFTALVTMAGLPGGVLAIFFSTCTLTDMGCTGVNVLGDLVCCKLIDSSLDKEGVK